MTSRRSPRPCAPPESARRSRPSRGSRLDCMAGEDPERIAVRATVGGDVQGVGLRDAVQREAPRLGVMGWVRNEEDGSVLVHAEGPEPAVEELLALLDEGPPPAR